jgi:hypothetical protein
MYISKARGDTVFTVNPSFTSVKHTIGWIPEWAAVAGNKVQLLSLDGQFWTITFAGEHRVRKDEIKESERAYKEFQGSLNGGGIDQ